MGKKVTYSIDLPKGKHIVMGFEFHTDTVSQDVLKELSARGCSYVKVVEPPAAETPKKSADKQEK